MAAVWHSPRMRQPVLEQLSTSDRGKHAASRPLPGAATTTSLQPAQATTPSRLAAAGASAAVASLCLLAQAIRTSRHRTCRHSSFIHRRHRLLRCRAAAATATASAVVDSSVALEQRLLEALRQEAAEEEILQLAGELEALKGDAEKFEVVCGLWDLRFTSTSKFDLEYPLGRRVDGSAPGLEAVIPAVSSTFGGGGDSEANSEATSSSGSSAPSSSPVQRFVTQNFRSTQEIQAGRVDTVVTLGDVGYLRLSAEAARDEQRELRLNFTFDLAYFQFGDLRIPYPVPFSLLGDEAKGWLETTYASESLRVSRGNKGTVFILTRSGNEVAKEALDNGASEESSTSTAVAQTRKESKVTIAPGSKGSVVVLPGLGNDSADYEALTEALSQLGYRVYTVQVARQDWLRNAAGIADIRWWQGVLEPRPVLDWYFERAAEALCKASSENAEQSVLIGHSAGGWLARVLLGSYLSSEESQGLVKKVVTLGSPHLPPLEGAEGTFDQTRGILSYVQRNCLELPEGIVGASVGSRCVLGSDDVSNITDFAIGVGYQQVYGMSTVWGDGIVPVPSMKMPGWEWRELEGIWHSPLGAIGRKWYGDDGVVEQWVDLLD